MRVPKLDFLFAVKPLSRRFRTLFRNAVRDAYARGTLKIPTEVVADAQALDLLLARSYRTDWHAYAKPPFGGPEHVLAYLAYYTHRIAISNRRILSSDGETVTFSWRDYTANNAQETMQLDAAEFLRRFLTHVLPPRFTRVRYYGFLANRDRSVNIAKARELIASRRPIRPRNPIPDPRLCPQCHKGSMRHIAQVDPQCRRTWFDTSRARRPVPTRSFEHRPRCVGRGVPLCRDSPIERVTRAPNRTVLTLVRLRIDAIGHEPAA